jgi:hypothetical protein
MKTGVVHTVQWLLAGVAMVALTCTESIGQGCIDQHNLVAAPVPHLSGATCTNINDPNQCQLRQTFVPSLPVLESVEVHLETAGYASRRGADLVTVLIEDTSGRILGSSSRGDIAYGFNGLARFDFARPIRVTPRHPYTLAVQSASWFYLWSWRDANPYPVGQAYVGGAPYGEKDFLFQTWGSPCPMPPRNDPLCSKINCGNKLPVRPGDPERNVPRTPAITNNRD